MKIGIAYDMLDDYHKMVDKNLLRYDFGTLEEITLLKNSLLEAGHDVFLYKGLNYIYDNIDKIKYEVDIILNRIEGYNNRNREGMLQPLLDVYDIPYVGSDAYACSLTMNKYHTKLLANHLGITTPNFKIIHTKDDINLIDSFDTFPIILKPNCEGSSDGVMLCYNKNDAYITAEKLLDRFSCPILCEQFIDGRELSASVIGNGKQTKLLGIVETLDNNGNTPIIYGFKEKFIQNMQKVIARLENDTFHKIKYQCIKLYNDLEIMDYARFDLRLSNNNIPYFLEVNTLPAIDHQSSFYNCIILQNMNFSDVLSTIIKEAYSRHVQK